MHTTVDFALDLEGRGSLGVKIKAQPQLDRQDPFIATRSYVNELLSRLGPVIGSLIFDVASFEACGAGGVGFMRSSVAMTKRKIPVVLDLSRASISGRRALEDFPGTAIVNFQARSSEDTEELLLAAKRTRGAVFLGLQQGNLSPSLAERDRFSNTIINPWILHNISDTAIRFREGKWSRVGVALPACSQEDILEISSLLPFSPILLTDISPDSAVRANGLVAVISDPHLDVGRRRQIKSAIRYGHWLALRSKPLTLAR